MNKYIIQKEKEQTDIHTSKQTNKKQRSSVCKGMETYKSFTKSIFF